MSRITSRKRHAETASMHRIYIAGDSNRKKKSFIFIVDIA